MSHPRGYIEILTLNTSNIGYFVKKKKINDVSCLLEFFFMLWVFFYDFILKRQFTLIMKSKGHLNLWMIV